MPTLDLNRQPKPQLDTLPKSRGFTLLEMLVVMAIIGLATGLVGPVLSNWLDRVVQRSELAEVMTQIRSLQNRAALLSMNVHLKKDTYAEVLPDTRPMLRMPAGWVILPMSDMVFTRTGLCGSGRAEIGAPSGQRITVEFSSADCTIVAVFSP